MKYQEWKDILQKGIDGDLSKHEIDTIRNQHTDWNCCAVGAKIMCDMKVDHLLTVNESLHGENGLINLEVWTLGNNDFPNAINHKNYTKALEVLEEIYAMKDIYKSDEQRDAFIEKELRANLPVI